MSPFSTVPTRSQPCLFSLLTAGQITLGKNTATQSIVGPLIGSKLNFSSPHHWQADSDGGKLEGIGWRGRKRGEKVNRGRCKRETKTMAGEKTVSQQGLLYGCPTPAAVIYMYYERLYLVMHLLGRLWTPRLSVLTTDQIAIFTNRHCTFLHFSMLILSVARGWVFFQKFSSCSIKQLERRNNKTHKWN